jgi:predicted HAD superfamily Cof-like phosphohydrolase
MGINEQWEMVKEFQRKFGHPTAPTAPALLGKARAEKREAWMLEEVREFMEAETIADQADAMIDLIYFALGTLVEMGVPPEGIFSIVHKANMDKLWEDGLPRWRADGKTMKPPGWQDPGPLIEEEIKRLGEKSNERAKP